MSDEMSDLLLRSIGVDPSFDDNLDHVVCCRDDNLALCGSDVTNSPWVHGHSSRDCIVCADLDEHDICPLGGVCDGGPE